MTLPSPQVRAAKACVSRASVRWTPHRKFDLCCAIRSRELTIAQACAEHDLSAEEVTRWLEGYDAHGLNGLRVRRRAA